MTSSAKEPGLLPRLPVSVAPFVPPHTLRDHLFISYAWEDQAFARWLALRLTSEGYRVWIDQLKLLGGESWPNDIDAAIKTRTFRMLGLLSKHSIAKPNPVKERTLALNLAKKPEMRGFLIPLNVDGLAAVDLDWLSSDITFIPFAASWAKGFAQLLKLLERERCPKFEGDGRAIVRSVAGNPDVVIQRPDTLTSNVQRFTQVPANLTVFKVEPKLGKGIAGDAGRDWAFYTVSPGLVVAFDAPEPDLATWLKADPVRTVNWRETSNVEGINTHNVVTSLLRSAVETRCRLRGLTWSRNSEAFYFGGPVGRSLPVLLPSGERTTVQHSGQRTYFRIGQPKVQYRYRLAAKPCVERDLWGEFALAWRLRFYFTDPAEEPLLPSQQLSRRKHVTRSWFNRHWLVRHLAVMQFLQDADGLMRIGPAGPQQVIVSGAPLSFVAPLAIDEEALESLQEIGDDVPVESEEAGNDHGDSDNSQ
ncbi:MAG: toll/interleukin-1 receptor domain-containing protein [Phycisphaerales bacterium]|nr:toll/interleukin-1 receptor domain-containing protein [Phycisphaerales bacterium]